MQVGALVICHDGKELKFKLTRTPMVGGTKFNLVLMDQMNNEKKIMVVVQLEQLQGTHGEARKDRPPPNHICGMLVRYKVVSPMCCSKNYRQGVVSNFAQ